MNKIVLPIFSLLLFTSIMKAQNMTSLSLEQALILSQKNSKELKLSQSQIEEAKALVGEAKDQNLPELKISAQANYLPSVNINIPALAGASSDSPSPDFLGLANASISIPLFTGFKISNGIAIAKYNKQIKEVNYAGIEQDVAIKTIEVFVNLYKAREAEKVVQANLDRAKETERNFLNMEKNGIVSRNDLLRIQLQESNVALALEETKKNIKILNFNLNLMLGLAEGTQIAPQLDFKYKEIGLSKEEYEKQAEAHRSEYQAVDLQSKIAMKQVGIAKSDYYPSIALTGSDMFINIHNIGSITNATMVGLGVSYNLSSLYKNHHKVDAAKSQLLQVQDNKELLDDQVRMQIYSAFEDYQYNIKRTHVYSKALEQADENYRIVKSKQENGLANTDELLTADVEQLQAILNEVYGNADVLLSYYKLLKQAGIISSINK